MTVWRGIFRPRSARSGGSLLLNNLGFYINGFFLRILPLGEKQRHSLNLTFRLNSLNIVHFIYFSSITKASSPTPKSTVDGSSGGNFRRGRRSAFLL